MNTLFISPISAIYLIHSPMTQTSLKSVWYRAGSPVTEYLSNFIKRRNERLLRFIVDPNVEPTNNMAERAFRPPVIDRKAS